ncbi:MAG: J domain-containing protein [Anaerolineae bacterium]
MRFDTIKISAYLVYLIQGQHPRMQVIDDGGDILHIKLNDSAATSAAADIFIYLIESDIAAYEIKNIVTENSARGVHSLFILWCDLLLPRDGMYYIPDEWMSVLLALHQDKIYAFDAFSPNDLFIFPIYFEGQGVARDIRHGQAIDPQQLNAKRIKTSYAPNDFWYVANFDVAPLAGHPMQVYFDLLGINPSTDRGLIKRAYRHLARKHHPDVSSGAGGDHSTRTMQQINDAYARILRHLDEQQQ